MEDKDLMTEAVRLATESVENGWGGPFGAVIAMDGEIVARGQNRVLLTGDPTAHAEVECIRKASLVLNPQAPTIPENHQNESTLTLVPRPRGSADVVPERARMLMGCSIYISGEPCPMCLSAIYWSRINAVYFAKDAVATREIGFDDAFQYEDFTRPKDKRTMPVRQIYQELGDRAYGAWMSKKDRHPY
jgi:tRNA(Arg) A34 adenosine deaminase TadA